MPRSESQLIKDLKERAELRILDSKLDKLWILDNINIGKVYFETNEPYEIMFNIGDEKNIFVLYVRDEEGSFAFISEDPLLLFALHPPVTYTKGDKESKENFFRVFQRDNISLLPPELFSFYHQKYNEYFANLNIPNKYSLETIDKIFKDDNLNDDKYGISTLKLYLYHFNELNNQTKTE